MSNETDNLPIWFMHGGLIVLSTVAVISIGVNFVNGLEMTRRFEEIKYLKLQLEETKGVKHGDRN